MKKQTTSKKFLGGKTFAYVSTQFIQSFFVGMLLLFVMSFPAYSQNCSVNAGIDIAVCANAPLAFSGGKTGSAVPARCRRGCPPRGGAR